MACAARFQAQLEKSLRQLANFEDGWKSLATMRGIDVRKKDKAGGTMLLQFRYRVGAPMESVLSFLRPEAVDSLARSPLGDVFSQTTEVKAFAPGDVVCSLRFKNWMSSLWMLLDGSRLHKCADFTEAGNIVMRMVLRHGVPRPGCTTMVGVELRDEWSTAPDVLDYGMVFEPTEGGAGVLISEVTEVPAMPWDLMRPVLEKISEAYNLDDWERYCKHASQEQLEESGFVVVALRKCCRGPPLFPVLPEGVAACPAGAELVDSLVWETAEDLSGFSLAQYLRHLLSLCGRDPSVVFDTLDGRQLVFFQAAVRRSVWPETWEALQPILKKQQAAYRRLHGGSGAPHVQANATARFQDTPHALPGDPMYISSAETPSTDDMDEATDWAWPMQVKNTFLHFTHAQSACDVESLP